MATKGAVSYTHLDGSAHVDYEKCKGCGRCIGVCPQGALHTGEAEGCAILARKISEYALAVVKGKPHFHLSLAIDISPFCCLLYTSMSRSFRDSEQIPSIPAEYIRNYATMGGVYLA